MDVTILDFTGVYRRQKFYKEASAQVTDCSDIPGTYGYCDAAAAKELRARIKSPAPDRICFLDSGNYHYCSLFLLEQITEPFDLVLFDHHTDMQPPGFSGLLSCGSWVLEAAVSLKNLRHIYMIGPDVDTANSDDYVSAQETRPARVNADRTEPQIDRCSTGKCRAGLPDADPFVPVYVSIDKDVLSKEVVITDWEQGNMTGQEFLKGLSQVFYNRRVLGMDVCGEPAADDREETIRASDRLNRELLAFYAQMNLCAGAKDIHF